MIREICRDEAFLARRAEPAAPEDRQTAADLLDTLEHHREGCVGMAANMIGVNKRIIAFDTRAPAWSCSTRRSSKNPAPMRRRRAVSPSLAPAGPGGGAEIIKVRWQNGQFQERIKTFTG